MANVNARLNGLPGTVTFAENTVNATPQRLVGDVGFSVDAAAGGTLSVSGLLAADRVEIAADAVVTLAGSDVLYEGTVVGRVAGGVGAPFSVTFGTAATAPAVEAVIERLTFRTVSDAPVENRILTFDFVDAAGVHARQGFSTSPDTTSSLAAFKTSSYSTPTTADLNGDGRLDLVVGTFDEKLRTFYANADGSFSEQVGPNDPLSGISTGTLSKASLADLNGDGRLDIVVSSLNGVGVPYYRNADGSFTRAASNDRYQGSSGGSSSAPALVDLDSDGDFDLVYGGGASNATQLRTYIQEGTRLTERTGTAHPFNGLDLGTTQFARPTFADVNGDGRIDLVVGTDDGTLRTFLRDAAGKFVAATGADNPFDGIDVGDFAAPTLADLNGDGHLDLIVGNGAGRVQVYSGGLGIKVRVTAENDPPALTGIGGELTVQRGTAGAQPQTLFAAAAFSDPDSPPGIVTVSGLGGSDRVALAAGGAVALSGNAVFYDGTAVGFVEGGNGADLTLSFNEAATEAAVTAIIRHLTFTTDTTATTTRDIRVTLADKAGGEATFGPLTVTYDAATYLSGIDLGGNDGTLRAGESVTLTLRFTSPVSVTGAPELALSGGGTARYVSGSGSGSLVFRYTAAAGENAADLTVTGLQGGTLRDDLEQAVDPIPADGIDPDGRLAVDTLAPDAPVLAGAASGGGDIYTTTPTLTGTAEAGTTIALSLDGVLYDTIVVGATGRFSFAVRDALDLGLHRVALAAEDAAGNRVVKFDSFTIRGETRTGTDEADTLRSGAGEDILVGLRGGDTYVVDSAGDRVVEAADGGIDTVLASLSYTLAANVENLTLTGTASLKATGNALANTLTGNAGANTLDGLGGTDTLIGGAGNDTYVVDRATDVMVERAKGGTDTVKASVSYTLGAGQEIEGLRTVSDAAKTSINLTGNAYANTITGNAGANVLAGGLGADTLKGGAGRDTFVFDTKPSSSNIDHITDFRPVDDTIRLENAVFTALKAGKLTADEFALVGSKSAAVDADAHILYEKASGTLYYDSNGGTASGRVAFAVIDNNATLTFQDFLVV